MTAVYLAAFAVGGIAVLVTLLLTDLDFGATHDGLPFLSLTSLSAGLLGAGTGGLVAGWAGAGRVGAGVIAAISAVALIAALQGVLLPYLRHQESNSAQGRSSYIGRLGTVTLEVPQDGWGEIAFVDADGNRVRARAVSAEPSALPKSTPVYISDVDADFVHVVVVPEH
ncbi:NfeD family protein [Mycolicibacterium confluentis]|uniref:Membrane protein NfeD2 N-terminal transmembrane domain-containing protein n=1 Tax=Mycolicibacterium confluentis TaxID=28047 RepID=A0A7I7Y0N4_9MYCO|nr:NfeD family protein [Mycolicibacterium confluentis]MCV7320113.1 hypothetical protein [Mycolicibacterium confluentis]ORV34646.1 hypothetical protein AWB99_03365 [Mycolicibacterium confluentis]BBZ35147.1 hypothetical protein MCNF_37520 [Mycolicibacterium confluentis]